MTDESTPLRVIEASTAQSFKLHGRRKGVAVRVSCAGPLLTANEHRLIEKALASSREVQSLIEAAGGVEQDVGLEIVRRPDSDGGFMGRLAISQSEQRIEELLLILPSLPPPPSVEQRRRLARRLKPARGLLSIAVGLLPSAVREQYRREFRGELEQIGGLVRPIYFAIGLIFATIRISRMISEAEKPQVSSGRESAPRLNFGATLLGLFAGMLTYFGMTLLGVPALIALSSAGVVAGSSEAVSYLLNRHRMNADREGR